MCVLGMALGSEDDFRRCQGTAIVGSPPQMADRNVAGMGICVYGVVTGVGMIRVICSSITWSL